MKTTLLYSVLLFGGLLMASSILVAQPSSPDENQIRLDDLKRIGAICQDGWRSKARGGGACAKHGGVRYWLYVEVPVYEAYGRNLPAIPENKLVPLTPEALVRLRQGLPGLLPYLPALPDIGIPEDTLPRRQKKRPAAEEKKWPRPDEEEPSSPRSTGWSVLDFLMPFVLVAALLLLFLLIYHIVRKLL
ncbi:MAG: hypothetical protein OHK0053_38550 [Microscillaceae bacterium]